MVTNMRRVTWKILILVFGVLLTVLYCEYLIYYVVIVQCRWPVLEKFGENESVLRALMIADTHLLGPRRGHWLDKMRREWQMHQAFQAILSLHSPEVVFVLGDLFDEGEWTNDKEFQDYVNRFHSLFAVPDNMKMYVTAGNHDIGFHNYIWHGSAERFNKLLNSSTVELVTLKNNHFVLINSMAMEGDSCYLCLEAREKIEEIASILDCSDTSTKCKNKNTRRLKYSRPILLQHFPLYRLSDALCTEPDAAPSPEREKKFRLKIDALSKEATNYLVSKIKPRVVFGGHTHHGCFLQHSYEVPDFINFNEYSIPSFSWRNRPDPKYMLVSITPNNYMVNKCGLPRETTIVATAVLLIISILWYTLRRRTVGSFRRLI